MAQVITCDPHGGEHRAEWLVTQIESGETIAYCDTAYMELMVGVVRAADQAEADQAAAEAERHLKAEGRQRRKAAKTDNPPLSDEDQAGDGQELDTAPARTVRKGTSSRRIAHEARQRARLPHEDGGELVPASGPDDDEDDDADEAAGGGEPPA